MGKTPTLLTTFTVAFAAGAIAVPAAASAATKPAKTPKTPTVMTVTPMSAKVGQTLVIKGHNFLPGTSRNTVVFKRDGAVAVFAKSASATSTTIRVKVPNKLLPFFAVNAGQLVPAKFRIRVLAARFGKSFTALAKSPTIAPVNLAAPGPGGSGTIIPGATPTPTPAAVIDPDCDGDGVPNSQDDDDDNDYLADALEVQLGTDPCKADTDGDGITDGYEYVSALDLNDRAIPYPGKRPYPNPLDASDAGYDFDGDGLTMQEEYSAWVKYGPKSLDLNYSDGNQKTKPLVAAQNLGTPVDFNGDGTIDAKEMSYLDINGDGVLSDDEKDVDGDGISNIDETHYRLNRDLWNTAVDERSYPLPYATLDFLDPDTDGDGVKDGMDDQDHDDISNLAELSRDLAGATGTDLHGLVNPYNPCLPDPDSRTCRHYWVIGSEPAPFQDRQGKPYTIPW